MGSESRWIAVLGGGKDSLGILRRIKQMGFKTLVFDKDKDAPAQEYLADHFVNISCYDPWHVLYYLKLQTAQTFSAVLCAGTDCPDVMAVVAKEQGLVGPSPRTAEISMNKWMQKKLFRDANIRVPEWIAGGNIRHGTDISSIHVIKPVSNRGSRGVMRLFPGDDILAAVNYAKQFDPREHTILEQWIDGVQLSSESLVQDGKIIYTAFSERNYGRLEETHPFVIEDGGDMPPDIIRIHENDYIEKAGAELQQVVTVMGLQTGILKGDLVWDGNNIWIIEVASRLSGGSFCSDQIPQTWGVDFIGMAVRLALGERIYRGEIRPFLRKHMAQRFVITPGIKSHPERGPGFIRYGAVRAIARYRAELAVERSEKENGESKDS